jgi:energy-coupling factor transporter ATP-binding protein EcfA2
VGLQVTAVLVRRTYYFDAHRIPKGTFPIVKNPVLLPDASNLAQCIATLQASPVDYSLYMDDVKSVLPTVRWVSAHPADQGGHVDLRVWSVDPSSQRDDLAFPLEECGAGIGQVLAILYVISRYRDALVIVDEPSSFLHPRAAKALMEIVRRSRTNQYLIATHSTDVISALRPDRLYVAQLKEQKTHLTLLDTTDLADLRLLLDEIGAQFSDVFGVDAIIWVEGATEAECFPLLTYATRGKPVPSGVSIAVLRSTGDLEGRHARIIAEIYRNMTKPNSILAPAVAVIFDGDKRSTVDVAAWEAVFGKTVHFLPRYAYENYLLDPDAIAAVLNGLPGFASAPVSPGRVNEWIIENGASAKFKAPNTAVLTKEWLESVDAPKLLDACFQSMSGSTEIFRKPAHSALLTTWLLQNNREHLSELMEFVDRHVPKAHGA